MNEVPPCWSARIGASWKTSRACLVAGFSPAGDLVLSNRAMDRLVKRNPSIPPSQLLRSPRLEALLAHEPSDEAVFEGVLTLGDGRKDNVSTLASAYRDESGLLVIAEYDAEELSAANAQMAAMNREVNNLQRLLLREKKALEASLEELRRTQEMLVHSEKMNALGQLVAGVAHEINNPLSFVSGNFASLADSTASLLEAVVKLEPLVRDEPDARAAMTRIRQDCDLDFVSTDLDDLVRGTSDGFARIRKIVDDLKTFSRVDEATWKMIDLEENIRATVALASPELKKREIRVEYDFDMLDLVECCPAELNQAFLNLIINGAQAIDVQGVIRIRARGLDDEVRLEFEDTGCGIPLEIREKIYDPFFTTKPVGQGTGLGLSLTHQIIQGRHHGTIRFQTETGKGTTFFLTIPRRRPQ